MDQEFGEIICKFQTDLEFKVPSNEISVPTSFTTSDLDELVHSLLTELNIECPLTFDFLVAGELLRSTLTEFMAEKNIKGEQTLLIHYVEKLNEPKLESQHDVQDWVVNILDFNSNLLIGQADGSVSLLGKPASTLHHVQARAYQLAFFDGNCTLLSAHLDNKVMVHSLKLASKKLQYVKKAIIKTQAECLAVNKSKGQLFCAGNFDGSVNIYDLSVMDESLNQPKLVKSYNLHKGLISCVHYDEETITSGSFDHHVHIFNVNKEKIHQLHCKDSAVYAISMDGSSLLSGHEDGYVRQWDLRENMQSRKHRAAQSAISQVKHFRPNQYLTTSFDGTLSIFDQRSELPLFRITHPDTKLLDVNQVGGKIYCGGSDKKVSVYTM